MALTDNLVAAYELDEASGNAVDAHGSNTLTGAGNPGATTGLISGARTFNGSNQYFSGSLLSGSKTAMTIEAWINRSNASHIMTCGWGTTPGSRLTILAFSDGNIYWQVDNAGSSNFPFCAFTGTGWHHLVMVFDGSQSTAADRIKGYIDGSLQSLAEGGVGNPASYTITGNFEIGREGANSRFSQGTHDMVRVWDRALSGAEVSELYNSGSGLAYEDFGGGGGITGTFPVIGGQGFVECEGEAGTLPVIGGQGSVIWNGETGTFPVTGGPGQYVEIE